MISLKKRTQKTRPLVVFVVGPTASGKTEIGLKLGQAFACEFISADSMQVYKGMDIITDKLPGQIRKEARYHLLDLVPASREFNAAEYCKAASAAIKAIVKKKKLPVVVGGTGLYVRSLVHGIFKKAARSEALRNKLELEAEGSGVEVLYERLKEFDPQAALRINRNDARRIIRALEVYETTKRPISELQKERKGISEDYEVRIFGIRRERKDLYERIERRVESMFGSGLLDEARRLLAKPLSKSASQCIGLREIEGFFKGNHGLDEAIRLMKLNSRHLAKRQMTWFRKEPGIEWIDVSAQMSAGEAAGIISNIIKAES